MVPIDFLSQAAWQRVAVTLLHFVWQGSAVAVLAALAVRLGRLGGGRGRYAVYLAALLGMAACPVVTFLAVEAPFTAPAEAEHVASLARPAEDEAVPAPRREARGVEVREAAPPPREAPDPPAAAPPAPVAAEDAPKPSATWRDVATRRLPAVLGWVSVMWLAGVCAMSLRLGLGVVGTVRWRRGLSPLGPPFAAAVEALCKRMGLDGFRRVFISPHVPQAVALGCLKPMVLLPAAMLTGMPAEMVEAIVAHELAHIRRLDLWVNLLQRVMETLLFFHPAVWWLSGRLRSERELCCDELAVAATGKRLTYAEALEHVYRSGLPAAQPIAAGALGAGKRTTLARVRHVLGLSASPGRSRWWSAGASALLVVLAIAIGLAVSSAGDGPAEVAADAPPAGGNYNHLLYIRQDIRDGGLRGNTLMLARMSGGEPRVTPLSAIGGSVYPGRRLLKVVRGRLYALYGRRLVEVDLKTGRHRIVADDVGARDYHPSGRLYFVGKDRLAVYDFPRGAFRDLGPSPFRQIREMRISISPDERRLAFCENVYEAKEKWSKAKPLPGAKATPSGLSPGYRHMLKTRIVVLDLRDGQQTRMPTPLATPYPPGGSREGPPPPLAWRDRKTVLVLRGDRAVRGRPTRGLAAVDIETGRMWDVLAIPGDHHTVPSFVVGERDGRVRLVLSRDRWAVDTYRIDLAAARLIEDNTLAAGIRLGHTGGSRCILHNRRPVSGSKGVAHVRASLDGKRVAWCVANAGASWVNRALHVYDVATAAPRKIADDYVAGAATWVADADLPPGEPPPLPPGWKRLTTRPWPKPRPRPVDNRPDVADVLSLTIATDKKEYTQHERVRITVTLTNKTRKAVTFPRPRLFVGLRYTHGSESLDEFDHPADMFPDDVVHLAAGQSVRCTRTVETYDLGKHTVGGQCGKSFAKWRGRLRARAATFVTRRTPDSDRVLKAKFDRRIAAFRRKLPTEGGAWQWGRQLGPTMARHMIAEIEASGDAKFRNRMGWALIGMGGRDVLRFCGRCLAGRMQTARGVVLDCLLRTYRNSSGTDRREALGLLVEALKHRDPRVRRGAAGRLSQVRHPGVTNALAAAVADDDAPTAVTAGRYLAAYEGLDLADWLAAAAKEPTHARYLAARAFINEIESTWQTGQAKPPLGTWRQVSQDPRSLEKFRNTVRAWERWARENPSFSDRFFFEARRHWPKPKPPPAATPTAVPWSETLSGLRVRLTAPAGTEYRRRSTLPLLVELHNAGDKPVRYADMMPTVRIKAADGRGKWLGIPRRSADISPWEGRTDSLPAGAVVRWTVWFDRLRFIKPLPAATSVHLRVSAPIQVLRPGKLPREVYSKSVVITLKDAHPSVPLEGDMPGQWTPATELVYRELGGLGGPYRAMRIDGRGRVILVARAKDPLLPPGRTETVLAKERLDKLARLLRDQKAWKLAQRPAVRPAVTDDGEIRLIVAGGVTSLVGDFPMAVARKQPALLAIRRAARAVMADAAAAAKRRDRNWGPSAEGLQVRLRADKPVWKAGEAPTCHADVRNHGPRTLFVAQSQQLCEIELDGRWYRWGGHISVKSSHLPPGRQYDNIRISLAGPWRGTKDNAPLKLTPGKHAVRAAFIAQPAARNVGPPVRAVSKAVTIEIEQALGSGR